MNLSEKGLKKLSTMTVLELAQMLEDGLLHSCLLNENMSVLEFIEKHFNAESDSNQA